MDEKEELLAPGQKFRKYFFRNLPMTIIFIMAVVIVFGLAIIVSQSLYITIPFLLIPLLFTNQVICADVEAGIGFTNNGITSSFGKYLMGPFRGCYRVIRSFLFAILIAFGITAVFAVIYLSVGCATSESFANALEAFTAVSEEEVAELGLTAYIANYPEITKLFVISQLVEGFIFTMVFSHFILSSAPLAILQGSPLALDRRAFGMILRGAIRKNRKKYAADYAKSAWISYLLLGIGYVLGVVISGFVMFKIGYVTLDDTTNYLTAAVFSLFSGIMLGLIMMSFSLSYFFYSVEDLTFSIMPAIRDYSLELAKDNLAQLKRYQQISEEEAKRYEEEIRRVEEELEEENKKDK